MDLREHFIKTAWWGKVIGAFFGFLVLGPIGALFGLLIGNFFDRGLIEHFNKPFWFYEAEENLEVKQVFFESVFLLLGHLAKIDGRVTEKSIVLTKQIMKQMGLNSDKKKSAQNLFNRGKERGYDLAHTLDRLQAAIGNKPNLIRLFIETVYQFIRETGLSEKKLTTLNKLLICLRLAPLHRQQHFTEDFYRYSTRQNTHHEQSYSSSYHQQPQRPFAPSFFDPYAVLGVKSGATKQEVTRAYRRLISKNHPDKLIAKGMPESAIKTANEKTQQIRKAYEQICEMKGW